MNRFKRAGAAFAFLIAILGGYEGLRLTGYLDIAGIPTYCYGKTGPEAVVGKIYPQDLCEKLLTDEGYKVWEAVDRRVKSKMTPWQWVALASLVYNIGDGAFAKSTVLRLANAGDWVGACNAILAWNKITDPRTGKKVVSKGLANRRASERLICLGYAWDADFSPNHRPIMSR
ncbi:lysozyme [Dongia sp.]|uniref:lysozyme n=1 Tax=Dongia sp. TaxID=1977262 RepID=UPI0035B298C0